MNSTSSTHIGLETETICIFAVLALLAFVLDMWAHRKDTPLSLKAATFWTIFWIAVAMGFATFLNFHFNSEVSSLFIAGCLLTIFL